MKLIDQSYKILQPEIYKQRNVVQEELLSAVYKQIELAGRTCYKSEDKITTDSAESFVQRMIDSGHTSMLEHGTVYLYTRNKEVYDKYCKNKYSKVQSIEQIYKKKADCYTEYYITTNYRVIVENGWEEDLKFMTEPMQYHHLRITVALTTCIHVYKDITRHRTMSYAIESTRFCNYNKDKFGNELTFIRPVWMEKETPFYDTAASLLVKQLESIESTYLNLITAGWQPQQAAEILPQCTKADVIMTGFVEDWEYIFNLRTSIIAKTGQPHPLVADLFDKIYLEFIDMEYIPKREL